MCRLSRARLLLIATSWLALGGCDNPITGVTRVPPFLAVVVAVDAPPEVNERGPYTFRVRELSGSIPFDTTFRASPQDTVILPVVAATYRVDVSDVPATCDVRDGRARAVVVPPNTNTSLVRFFVTCSPGLTVVTGTDGPTADPDYVVSAIGPGGTAFAAVLTANDTVRFAQMPPGEYEVSLRLVSSDCVVTSDGGQTLRTNVQSGATTLVRFRIVCSNPERRPRILGLVNSFHEGAIGYSLTAFDPNRDVLRSYVDVTDCNRRSLLSGGALLRSGLLLSTSVFDRDTARILGAYDVPLTDAALQGRCLAVWVEDNQGNISPIVELPLRRRDAARAPAFPSFNGLLNGTRSVTVTAEPTDPQGDYLGTFLVYLVRDGVLTTANGQPDRVLVDPAGLFGPRLNTELAVGIGFGAWNDYLGVILYGIDAEGNMTRVVDLDLFR